MQFDGCKVDEIELVIVRGPVARMSAVKAQLEAQAWRVTAHTEQKLADGSPGFRMMAERIRSLG